MKRILIYDPHVDASCLHIYSKCILLQDNAVVARHTVIVDYDRDFPYDFTELKGEICRQFDVTDDQLIQL